MPIDVDSYGEDVNKVYSREAKAKRPATIQIGQYKHTSIALGDGKRPKRQRKLTSGVWEHYEFLPPDEEGNLFYKCKKMWPNLF